MPVRRALEVEALAGRGLRRCDVSTKGISADVGGAHIAPYDVLNDQADHALPTVGAIRCAIARYGLNRS